MIKQLRPAITSVFAFTILTGLLFPLLITAVAQIAFPFQANGSLITQNGQIVGSQLIGQNFSQAKYFHPRPSAAGSGYDAANSSGTNLGPTSSKLIKGIADDPKTKDSDESFEGIPQLAKTFRDENGLSPETALPVDTVTRSASGLDPHISPRNAQLQAARVAKARGLSAEKVRQIIEANTQSPQLGILGEARVNVLNLNRALDAAAPDKAPN